MQVELLCAEEAGQAPQLSLTGSRKPHKPTSDDRLADMMNGYPYAAAQRLFTSCLWELKTEFLGTPLAYAIEAISDAGADRFNAIK